MATSRTREQKLADLRAVELEIKAQRQLVKSTNDPLRKVQEIDILLNALDRQRNILLDLVEDPRLKEIMASLSSPGRKGRLRALTN